MIGGGANMAHKCFISFKKEDQWYRDKIDNLFSASDIINKGLDRVIDSNDGDYIMKTIRQDYLKDSMLRYFSLGHIRLKMRDVIIWDGVKTISSNVNCKPPYSMVKVTRETVFWVLFSLRCVIKSTRELTNAKNVMERIVMLLLMTRQ